MKYKCKLKVTNDDEGVYFIKVDCFSWKYLDERFYLEVLRGEDALLNYYKNMNINKVINQIKGHIIKKHYPSYEVKETMKLIEQKGNKIIINI